ncbi:MAG: hypothetical protein FJW32_29540 [Acidobacteria bacterium]|nr:hypothetical protein [Acidobacteriota bacterium]
MNVPKSATSRAHVVLPVDLVAAIDELVGKRGRSAFLAEIAQREIKIRRQQQAIREAAGSWDLAAHPELAQGGAAWERRIRALDNPRLEKLERSRNRK